MSTASRVHYMALDKAKRQLQDVKDQYHEASKGLDEAIKLGDLSENVEYEILKEKVARLAKERDELESVVSMPVVKASDSLPTIEEGGIIELKVWSITKVPLQVGSAEFEAVKQKTPEFEGILMHGATLSMQELLVDNALSEESPIGRQLIGKQSGDYSLSVPAGFANLTVKKLPTTTSFESLYCE